jgi:hypothetical protein
MKSVVIVFGFFIQPQNWKPLQDDPNSEREKNLLQRRNSKLNPCKSNNSEAIKIGKNQRLALANPFNPHSNEENRNLLLRIKNNKIKKESKVKFRVIKKASSSPAGFLKNLHHPYLSESRFN